MAITQPLVTPAIDNIIQAQFPPLDADAFAAALVRIRAVVTSASYHRERGDADAVLKFVDAVFKGGVGPVLDGGDQPQSDTTQLSYALAIAAELKRIYTALIDAGQPHPHASVEFP
jgi:hypothetical protein